MNLQTLEPKSPKHTAVVPPTKKVSRFQVIVESVEEEAWPPKLVNLKPAPEPV